MGCQGSKAVVNEEERLSFLSKVAQLKLVANLWCSAKGCTAKGVVFRSILRQNHYCRSSYMFTSGFDTSKLWKRSSNTSLVAQVELFKRLPREQRKVVRFQR